MNSEKPLDPELWYRDMLLDMRFVRHIYSALLAALLFVSLASAPVMAKVAAHACCPETEMSFSTTYMDGTLIHSQHVKSMGQNNAHGGHDRSSSKAPCSIACCAGFANIVALPDPLGKQDDYYGAAPLYELTPQVGLSVTHSIVTPPPRLLTFS